MICDKKLIGNKFKEYRKQAKYTQEELSELVGIAEKHYGKLERGLSFPSLETFFKIVEVLNIPIEEFGLTIPNTSKDKEKLLKAIYSATKQETQLYLEIYDSINKYNQKIINKE